MKKCSWCGAEYRDDVTFCPIDQREVINPSSPKPAAPYPGIRVTLSNLCGDPPPTQSPIPRPAMLEYFELFIRYIAALIVLGIVGFIVMLLMMMTGFAVLFLTERFFYPPWIVVVTGCCIAGFLAGCIGAFCGALILPRGKRGFGSISFLVIGIAYWGMMICNRPHTHRDYEIVLDFWFWMLWASSALGIILNAVFFNWGRWPGYQPRQPIVPENAAKISGDLP